jgi:hypothetical protein
VSPQTDEGAPFAVERSLPHDAHGEGRNDAVDRFLIRGIRGRGSHVAPILPGHGDGSPVNGPIRGTHRRPRSRRSPSGPARVPPWRSSSRLDRRRARIGPDVTPCRTVRRCPSPALDRPSDPNGEWPRFHRVPLGAPFGTGRAATGGSTRRWGGAMPGVDATPTRCCRVGVAASTAGREAQGRAGGTA